MTTHDDLTHRIPPPRRSSAGPVDWAALETRIGTGLPSDYKWLVGHYGPGVFDDFLHVLQPTAGHEAIRLEYCIERMNRTLDYLRGGGEEIPFSNDELLPAVLSDNGDTVYWRRWPRDDPERWTVVANEARGTSWVWFDGGLVAFLAAALDGSFPVPIFPEDFPSEKPRFEPYDA